MASPTDGSDGTDCKQGNFGRVGKDPLTLLEGTSVLERIREETLPEPVNTQDSQQGIQCELYDEYAHAQVDHSGVVDLIRSDNWEQLWDARRSDWDGNSTLAFPATTAAPDTWKKADLTNRWRSECWEAFMTDGKNGKYGTLDRTVFKSWEQKELAVSYRKHKEAVQIVRKSGYY
ncbi:hypothetical protein PsorP6_004856 [Peronosclerospora sorghi]|uniref:Uncharacterized protein n=1 Tax=Peronosclerospora sorghi TaxID=230839 RepID=A0ACC0W7G0_9STRA|nr:hypothetical protein PsorP6_004856 [Peronosclerospora sorghi]